VSGDLFIFLGAQAEYLDWVADRTTGEGELYETRNRQVIGTEATLILVPGRPTAIWHMDGFVFEFRGNFESLGLHPQRSHPQCQPQRSWRYRVRGCGRCRFHRVRHADPQLWGDHQHRLSRRTRKHDRVDIVHRSARNRRLDPPLPRRQFCDTPPDPRLPTGAAQKGVQCFREER